MPPGTAPTPTPPLPLYASGVQNEVILIRRQSTIHILYCWASVSMLTRAFSAMFQKQLWSHCDDLGHVSPVSPTYIKTTAAVFCLSSSRSTARSTLYSLQTGVASCRRQHVERPSVPHHICTVTRGLQTASQVFPLLSSLPKHPDMTYLSLLIIVAFLFSGFSCGLFNT